MFSLSGFSALIQINSAFMYCPWQCFWDSWHRVTLH